MAGNAAPGTTATNGNDGANPSRAVSNEYEVEAHELETAHSGDGAEVVKMRNHIWVSVLAVAIWLVIAIMNVALLVLVGLGEA